MFVATRTFDCRPVAAVGVLWLPTGGTYVWPTDLVCRHAEGGALFFFDQRRRQLAFRQIRCASHKLAGNLLCLSRAAGRARELALPSQRNHLRGRDGRHLQLFAADGDARTYARTLAHAQAHPRSHAHTDARHTHTHTHTHTHARTHARTLTTACAYTHAKSLHARHLQCTVRRVHRLAWRLHEGQHAHEQVHDA